ncbi:MAG: SOS response-associated peptidase [Alphaproteobacteria bacterium]|nr:SOS response-associated peptidase [Alphaproteobacteria bacterium]
MNHAFFPVMCGRFFLTSPPSDVGDLFDLALRENFPPRYNIAPSQPIAVIRQNDSPVRDARQREFALVRWGFIPGWARGEHLQRVSAKPLINARSETVDEKPTFRSAYKRRRCLVPANGFYEWRAGADGKQPFAIQRPDAGLIAFAAIWETANDPDGGEIDTAAILTTASGPDLRGLHAREPVVIAREHFALWLEADERDTGLLSGLMAPAPAGTWDYYPVSKAVNSPRQDGPDMIAPLAA